VRFSRRGAIQIDVYLYHYLRCLVQIQRVLSRGSGVCIWLILTSRRTQVHCVLKLHLKTYSLHEMLALNRHSAKGFQLLGDFVPRPPIWLVCGPHFVSINPDFGVTPCRCKYLARRPRINNGEMYGLGSSHYRSDVTTRYVRDHQHEQCLTKSWTLCFDVMERFCRVTLRSLLVACYRTYHFCPVSANFYRAPHMHSAVYAVARCLSVRPSVRQSVCHTDVLCRNNKTHHHWIVTLTTDNKHGDWSVMDMCLYGSRLGR